MYKCETDSDLIIHIECIGLYTELIGWHCLGADSYLILEEALYDFDAMAWRVMQVPLVGHANGTTLTPKKKL